MPNGVTCAFDENDQQVGEFQEAWFKLYIKFLKEKGMTGKQIEQIQFKMPDRTTSKYISKYDNWT